MYWLVSLAALVGVVLNIRKHVGCFWIWSFTNLVWACVDWSRGLYAQAVLMVVYFLLAVWGIWRWSQRGGIGDKEASR
jgi:nicotinamide riboside transporter PnuC